MTYAQTLQAFELLDTPSANGEIVKKVLQNMGAVDVQVTRIQENNCAPTDFIKITIPGKSGKIKGGKTPTLGIIGQLGGVGARPEQIGFVSDGDGACTAIAAALKLARMDYLGDKLPGDVIITTHICPASPVKPHDPVPFMNSPVSNETMNRYLVDGQMDGILSVDTTKGNRILNHKGFAITPTVKEGYILRVSEDLLDIMSYTSGSLPRVLPITMQDITPYGNEIFHINSIMQPAVVTSAPCVGVAITTESVVPGCASGATHLEDIDKVVRFCIETAKSFGKGICHFYDQEEFRRITQLYGSMAHLQTLGKY